MTLEERRLYDREWRKKNVAKTRAACKRWRDKNIEKERERCRKWRAENPDKQRAANIAWIQNNPEKAKANYNDWRKQNPDRAKLRGMRRRLAESKAPGKCSAEQLEARIEYYGENCWVPGCGKRYEAIDHVIPVSKGGTNWPSNLRPICKSHNSKKRNKLVVDFLRSL